MLAEESAAPLLPRWAAAAWVWLPAVVVLLLFGGVALLQQGGGSAVWWWAAAAGVCAGAYAVRERWPVLALVLSLLVVAAARLPGVGLLQSGFDVAYLLLLFVPVLPLVATATVAGAAVVRVGSCSRRSWSRSLSLLTPSGRQRATPRKGGLSSTSWRWVCLR